MDNIIDFYETLGFEEIEFDGQPVLFLELDDEGNYAIVTDEDGVMPETVTRPVLFSVYNYTDAFQWSVTLEDSVFLADLYKRCPDLTDVLKNLQEYRSENIKHFML